MRSQKQISWKPSSPCCYSSRHPPNRCSAPDSTGHSPRRSTWFRYISTDNRSASNPQPIHTRDLLSYSSISKETAPTQDGVFVAYSLHTAPIKLTYLAIINRNYSQQILQFNFFTLQYPALGHIATANDHLLPPKFKKQKYQVISINLYSRTVIGRGRGGLLARVNCESKNPYVFPIISRAASVKPPNFKIDEAIHVSPKAVGQLAGAHRSLQRSQFPSFGVC